MDTDDTVDNRDLSAPPTPKAKKLKAVGNKLGEMIIQQLRLRQRIKVKAALTGILGTAQDKRDLAILTRKLTVCDTQYNKLLIQAAKLV